MRLRKCRDGQRQEGGEEETEEGSELDETLSNLLQKIAEEKFLLDEESDLKRNLEEEAQILNWTVSTKIQ